MVNWQEQNFCEAFPGRLLHSCCHFFSSHGRQQCGKNLLLDEYGSKLCQIFTPGHSIRNWFNKRFPGWFWHQADPTHPCDCPLLQRSRNWRLASCWSCWRNARSSGCWLPWQSSNPWSGRWALVVLVRGWQICVQGRVRLPCWSVWLWCSLLDCLWHAGNTIIISCNFLKP